MTLNLERKGILVIFVQFSAAAHVLRVNCAKIAGDRGQPAYKIF